MKKLLLLLLAFCSVAVAAAGQQLVRYELNITDTVVNYTGKSRPAFAVNGMIPMPTLYFTEGDTAEVVVTNHSITRLPSIGTGCCCPTSRTACPT